jgi:hypothetical protein
MANPDVTAHLFRFMTVPIGLAVLPAYLRCSRCSGPSVMSRSGQAWSVGMIQSSPMEAWRGRVTM